MAWAGIPNGLPALIVIPVGGRPPCHLCYSRRVSDVFPAVGGQIAPSWAGAAGIIRSGNCSQGKFSEELACDGWERWCGVGWAGRGWGSWRRQTGAGQRQGEHRQHLGRKARTCIYPEGTRGVDGKDSGPAVLLGERAAEWQMAGALGPRDPQLPEGGDLRSPSGCQLCRPFVPEIVQLWEGGILTLI